MFQHLPKLFTSPRDAWDPIRSHADAHPWSFLPVLLLFALIPAVSTYFGTAHLGWEVYGSEEQHHLRSSSAMYLGLMVYLAYLTGVVVMSFMVRWILFRTPGRPTLLQSLCYTTCLTLPLMIGGFVAAVPYRWMLLVVAPLAVLYSLVLLFRGLPVYMHLKRNDETRFYAACVVMVGLLVLVTTGVLFLELWWVPQTGAEYVESLDEPQLD